MMNKIESIKRQIKLWRSVEDGHRKIGNSEDAKCAHFMVNGLKTALGIFEEPPNTQMQIEARPDCVLCKNYRERLYKYNYCGMCGKALHD